MLLMFRSPGEESDYTRMFRSQKVDACIILGAMDTPGERAELKKLEEGGFPFCLVNQHYAGERYNEVDADHETGSYLAVRHLLDSGYRGIAMLNGPPPFSNSGDRLRGYARALREAGLLEPGTEAGVRDGIPPHWYYEGNYSRTSGYKAAAEIYRHLGRIDAIFVSNDRMAVGLMQGLRELGCIPGKDLAVIGYDDSDAARMTDPPLTSVAVPFYEMGRLAAKNLLLRSAGGPEADAGLDAFQLKLETKLIIRQSCRKKNLKLPRRESALMEEAEFRMKQVRVGMVGYKFMGKAHSHAYRDLPMFFPKTAKPVMKAICGRDADGVAQAAEQFGWESYTTDWRELVKRDDIDLIDINAPSDAHKAIALAAAAGGKHVSARSRWR